MLIEIPAKNKALTAAFVSNVKKPGKYHDGNGTGLFLLVQPSGARSWVQRVTIRGRRRELGLGSPPIVTLAEARKQALDNKRLARAGGDPLADKQRAKQVLTFAEAARQTHIELSPTWKIQEVQKERLDIYAPTKGAFEGAQKSGLSAKVWTFGH
jgi:hypothetical protein